MNTSDPAELPPHPDTVNLLAEYEAGDDTALGKLVEKETPWLVARIGRRLPDYLKQRVGVSDIVQATAIDLCAIQERFENNGAHAFRKMLAKIADLNVAKVIEREHAQKRDAGREARHAAGLSQGDTQSLFAALSAGQTTPSELAMGEELKELLHHCYRFLSPADQEILRRIDFDGESYADAADELAIEVDTARRRHSRAIERLRRLLEKAEKKRGG